MRNAKLGMWNAKCKMQNWGWFLQCKNLHKIFRLLIRQTAFDTFSHRRRLADVELLTIDWCKAYFQYTHRSSSQIKRRLPPRGLLPIRWGDVSEADRGGGTLVSRRSRVEEYACIMKFNIFMPKNSFRHCFAMPPPSRGRLWKLSFSRDSSSVKLRLTPSPTGEGLRMLSFWQQFDIKHTFSLLLWEKGDRASGGWVDFKTDLIPIRC